MSELTAINGTQLNVRVENTDPARPWVIFSNSLATNLTIFDAQASALKNRFNVIRYDQRGHGDSHVSDQCGFDTLGQDVLSILDHVGADRCTYVGLSMGVPTGLAAIKAQPERFNTLVFIDGQAASAEGAADQWQARIDIAVEQGMTSFSKATAERWLVDPPKAIRVKLQEMIAATALDGFVACATALKSYDYSSIISTISVPVLFMAGENDGAMPAKMEALSRELPNAQFHAIKSAGHVPCFEQPDAVNTILVNFLNTLGDYQ